MGSKNTGLPTHLASMFRPTLPLPPELPPAKDSAVSPPAPPPRSGPRSRLPVIGWLIRFSLTSTCSDGCDCMPRTAKRS